MYNEIDKNHLDYNDIDILDLQKFRHILHKHCMLTTYEDSASNSF